MCLSSPGEERTHGAVPVLKRGSMRFVLSKCLCQQCSSASCLTSKVHETQFGSRFCVWHVCCLAGGGVFPLLQILCVCSDHTPISHTVLLVCVLTSLALETSQQGNSCVWLLHSLLFFWGKWLSWLALLPSQIQESEHWLGHWCQALNVMAPCALTPLRADSSYRCSAYQLDGCWLASCQTNELPARAGSICPAMLMDSLEYLLWRGWHTAALWWGQCWIVKWLFSTSVVQCQLHQLWKTIFSRVSPKGTLRNCCTWWMWSGDNCASWG